LLWDCIEETFGINHLATGHYARVSEADGQRQLGRAKDKSKDQSYFIYGITTEKLQRFVLPLGKLSKNEVRSTATQLNLSVADKAESMELCFAGEGDYRLALDDVEADRQGDLTDMQGNRIGTHKGIANYTLGQRQGIGYAGGKPLYVGKIDAEANIIALGTREEVSTHTVKANRINVLLPEELVKGGKFLGKIRSYGDPKPCTIIEIGEKSITADFEQPQFAPCPGQRLVLYNNSDNIVVGGTISAQN
jgi:tRNA-specific 2-thiouridylase